MNRYAKLFACVFGTCALFGFNHVNAALIFQESFEGTHQYSVENEGQQGADNFFTVVTDSSLTLGYTPGNIDGDNYFGGRDLNGFPSGSSHRVTFNEIDLTNYQDIVLTLSLSARESQIYESGDAVTLEFSSDGGSSFSLLDQFSGATGGALLSNGNYSLGETLLDVSYVLPDVIDSLVFRVQTDTFLASNEVVAFDNFRVDATASVPEPETLFLLGMGLALLQVSQLRRKG